MGPQEILHMRDLNDMFQCLFFIPERNILPVANFKLYFCHVFCGVIRSWNISVRVQKHKLLLLNRVATTFSFSSQTQLIQSMKNCN